jgi:hypothetical protein
LSFARHGTGVVSIRGAYFRVEISEQGHTDALIQGRRISFGIEEHQEGRNPKAASPNPTDRWDYDQFVTYEPSGMLALVINSGTWETSSLRTKWSDAKIQRVEKAYSRFCCRADADSRRPLAKGRAIDPVRRVPQTVQHTGRSVA